jgi:hypothetical protein
MGISDVAKAGGTCAGVKQAYKHTHAHTQHAQEQTQARTYQHLQPSTRALPQSDVPPVESCLQYAGMIPSQTQTAFHLPPRGPRSRRLPLPLTRAEALQR